jgi:hypothetical protein
MTIQLQPRDLHLMFHIDTNRLNARRALATMNQIEKWADDEVILINMSAAAYDEARAGSSPQRTRKATGFIFTIETEDEILEHPSYQHIETALFPDGAKDQNQRNDVLVVFEAQKYGAILITNDGASKSQPGGILGNRDKLKGMVRILSDAEAVEFIRSKIAARDELNRSIAKELGLPIPEWTGQD